MTPEYRTTCLRGGQPAAKDGDGMPAKAKPSAYALDLLVQTTLDNLARDAKRKLGKASAVVSFKLLRYDVALWPDSCELVLADAQAPVVVDLDRGKVSAIPGTVDDANPLATAHRRRAPEIADDAQLAQDANILEPRALLGRVLNVARAQLVRGIPLPWPPPVWQWLLMSPVP
jgi:hypothetical protein